MDPYLKRRWVEALRSGRYRQGDLVDDGSGLLVHDSGHCCLGVLIEVAAGHVEEKEDSVLFRAVGLGRHECRRLANMNDGRMAVRRSTFAEIADVIEAEL